MGLQQALATITQPVHATRYACHPACPLGPVMGVAGAPCASSATMVGQLLQQVISAAHGEVTWALQTLPCCGIKECQVINDNLH
jgi:hypothetical protein